MKKLKLKKEIFKIGQMFFCRSTNEHYILLNLEWKRRFYCVETTKEFSLDAYAFYFKLNNQIWNYA